MFFKLMKIIFCNLLILNFFLIGIQIFPFSLQEEGTGKLLNIKISKSEKELLVIIEIEGKFNYENFRLIDPNRLVFDLWHVEDFYTQPGIDVNFCGVDKVEVTKLYPRVIRVAFYLREPLPIFEIERVENGIKITFRLKEGVCKEIEKVEKIKPEIKKVPAKVEKIKIPRKKREKKRLNFLVGFYGGKYNVRSSRFKEVYGGGAPIWSLELAHRIYHIDKHNFNIKLGIGYFSKRGEATVTKEAVRFTLKPIIFGVDYLIRVHESLTPFAGFGLDYFIYKEDWRLFNAKDTTLGYYLNGGLYYSIPKIRNLKVKFYLMYSQGKTKPEGSNIEEKVNIGGFQFGLGLIWTFDILL